MVSASSTSNLSSNIALPRISIVTPSYNQGQFLEETICSVLQQDYPNLEYIIIDGGSSDRSLEIIQHYSSSITDWVSERDHGQTDAIQKGFERCTGTLWNWLNSDDVLEPGALKQIAAAYQANPNATIYSGKLTVFGEGLEPFLYTPCFQNLNELMCVWERWAVPQPAIFIAKDACSTVGGLNSQLHYGMDYELYLRLAQHPDFKVCNINVPIARIRRHPDSKTVSQQMLFRQEILQIFNQFSQSNPLLLPPGWRRSRDLFAYISDLTCADSCNVNDLDLTTFIKKTIPHFKSVWKYRYFWGCLRQQFHLF